MESFHKKWYNYSIHAKLKQPDVRYEIDSIIENFARWIVDLQSRSETLTKNVCLCICSAVGTGIDITADSENVPVLGAFIHWCLLSSNRKK